MTNDDDRWDSVKLFYPLFASSFSYLKSIPIKHGCNGAWTTFFCRDSDIAKDMVVYHPETNIWSNDNLCICLIMKEGSLENE